MSIALRVWVFGGDLADLATLRERAIRKEAN